ncbi:MAG: AGE family epimerase/isomerase [Psychroserpens sp.]|uniref:AGE family epimerase/isomerase n=1 Tax=Psychroserpens sp. TaxID=2020870 RepID=UPI003002769A
MTLRKALAILILVLLAFGCKSEPEKLNVHIKNTKIDWIYQVDSLLMPFWMVDEAIGDPMGNYPNYRNRIGEVLTYENFDFKKVPKEFAPFLIDQPDSLRRNYIRINSRQVYTYCAAYNMTGNEAYLKRAKLGVDYLLENGGYSTGSPYTYWQDGKGMPGKFQCTTQDLAYSLTGLTMYYYLTRDETVLENILKVKDFVISEYYDNSSLVEKTKLVMWVKDNYEGDTSNDKRLLAVLDQLNAYLLFITPLVPNELSESFKNDVKNLAYSLKDNFYDAKYNLFWGDLNNKKLGESPTDFGHSIKSFWMLYLAGQLLNDNSLEDFAKKNAINLLKIAYTKENGSWAEMYTDSTLTISKTKVWWNYAELDQMAATMSLADTTFYTNYLKKTYKYWQENMIDSKNKETYLVLDEFGNPIDLGLKTCHWKNGFHSLEHALIGFLSTANYYGDEIPLYFAFKKDKKPERRKVKPYYFNANIIKYEESEFSNVLFNNFQKTKVIFQNIN